MRFPVCDVECPGRRYARVRAVRATTPTMVVGDGRMRSRPTAGDQTICGTIYADNGTDSDWFEYVAMADDTMTWTVRSNFASHIGLVEQYVPGEPGCSNWTYNFNPSAVTSDCEDVSISFPVTAGGTYYLFIEPQSYSGSPCGTTNDYVATLTGSICGDLDDDGDVDYDDYVIFLAAFGGPVDGNPPQDAECDYDDSGAVGMADYAAWLACYRDFVGDPLAGPPIGGDDIPAPTIVDPSHGSSRPRPQLRSDQSRTGRGLEAIATCSGDDRPHCMPCMCGRRRPPRCSRSEDTRGIIQTNEHFRTARATASDGRSEELIGGRGQWCFRKTDLRSSFDSADTGPAGVGGHAGLARAGQPRRSTSADSSMSI